MRWKLSYTIRYLNVIHEPTLVKSFYFVIEKLSKRLKMLNKTIVGMENYWKQPQNIILIIFKPIFVMIPITSLIWFKHFII